MEYSRPQIDLGLLTNQKEAMLSFWHQTLGLDITQELHPAEGVCQYKLDLCGAVLKLNCVEMNLPSQRPLNGIRMLLLAKDDIDSPRHLQDPDGNLVCLVPPGYSGIQNYGIHMAVSDEATFEQFYGEILQLTKIGDRTYDWAGTIVSFAWSPEVQPNADTTGIGYYYLTTQVVDTVSAHEKLMLRGARELATPSDQHTNTDSIISFILDPDGNRVEISQRPDLVAHHLNTLRGKTT